MKQIQMLAFYLSLLTANVISFGIGYKAGWNNRAEIEPYLNPIPVKVNTEVEPILPEVITALDEPVFEELPLPKEKEVLGVDLLMFEPIPRLKKSRKHSI